MSSPSAKFLFNRWLRYFPYRIAERICPAGGGPLQTAGRNSIYLTFDDGPDPESTPEILEILHASGCKATFFVLGEQAGKHPELVRRILSEGHSLGNHTASHPHWMLTNRHLEDQIRRTDEILEQITGTRPRLFRPPHGRIFPWQARVLRRLNKRAVLWSVFVPDFLPGFTSREIAAAVRQNSKEGDIVLLHDRSPNARATVQALPDILNHCRERGWRCASLPSGTDNFPRGLGRRTEDPAVLHPDQKEEAE